jgi:SAM-dependent methyltransferase
MVALAAPPQSPTLTSTAASAAIDRIVIDLSPAVLKAMRPMSLDIQRRNCGLALQQEFAPGGMGSHATNPARGNFAGTQDGRLQGASLNRERQRSHVRSLMHMTIATVFAATFAISVCAQEFLAQEFLAQEFLAQEFLAQEFLAGPGVPAAAFPKPDRPIADIISPIWHDEKERDAAGEPRQLVHLLGIRSGMTVADIGAGSGYYVVRLSPIVGPRGRIIAEDVVPEYLQDLRRRVRDRRLQNVVISRGEAHDPRLPAASLDIAILVHMYHEIAQPYGLLYNLIPALKPGARVGILDAYGPTVEHGTPPSLLQCELAAVGYRQIGLRAATPIWQSLRRHRLRTGRRRKPWSRARPRRA